MAQFTFSTRRAIKWFKMRMAVSYSKINMAIGFKGIFMAKLLDMIQREI